MAEFTAPATESAYVEAEGPAAESIAEVPESDATVPSVEDEVEPTNEDLSMYITGSGIYVGPESAQSGGTTVASLADMKKVYQILDSCKNIDQIASQTGLARDIVLECVRELVDTYHLIAQDDDRFCNIAAVASLQGQFEKICVACAKR